MKKFLYSSIVAASLVLTGCGSDSDDEHTEMDHEHSSKTLFFYDSVNKTLYSYDTEHEEATDLNSDTENMVDLSDDESANMIYWPHNMDGNITDKYIFTSEEFDINDGNLTHENIVLVGPMGDLDHAHLPEFFNLDNYGEGTQKTKITNTLAVINTHLHTQEEVKNEIIEALSNEVSINGSLCDYYVPVHEEHEEEEGDEEEHEETPHFVLTTDGKVHVFTEGENGLEKHSINITLTGADECVPGQSGITSASDHGVYVYSNDSKALHLVDHHDSAYHEHGSPTPLSEILPQGVGATQMIGTDASDEDHDEDHDH